MSPFATSPRASCGTLRSRLTGRGGTRASCANVARRGGDLAARTPIRRVADAKAKVAIVAARSTSGHRETTIARGLIRLSKPMRGRLISRRDGRSTANDPSLVRVHRVRRSTTSGDVPTIATDSARRMRLEIQRLATATHALAPIPARALTCLRGQPQTLGATHIRGRAISDPAHVLIHAIVVSRVIASASLLPAISIARAVGTQRQNILVAASTATRRKADGRVSALIVRAMVPGDPNQRDATVGRIVVLARNNGVVLAKSSGGFLAKSRSAGFESSRIEAQASRVGVLATAGRLDASRASTQADVATSTRSRRASVLARTRPARVVLNRDVERIMAADGHRIETAIHRGAIAVRGTETAMHPVEAAVRRGRTQGRRAGATPLAPVNSAVLRVATVARRRKTTDLNQVKARSPRIVTDGHRKTAAPLNVSSAFRSATLARTSTVKIRDATASEAQAPIDHDQTDRRVHAMS